MPYKDESKRKEYQNKYKKNHRWLRYQQWDALLGTTSFKPHLCRKPNGKPDWKRESFMIRKEKERVLHGRYKHYGNRRKYLRHKFLSTEEN